MAVTKRTVAPPRTVPSPSRRLVAAGIKRGPAAWLVEQPMTQTDRERHTARCYGLWAAATNFRRSTASAR